MLSHTDEPLFEAPSADVQMVMMRSAMAGFVGRDKVDVACVDSACEPFMAQCDS